MKRLITFGVCLLGFLLGVPALTAQDEGSTGKVGGIIFKDANGNGVLDEGEEVAPPATVTLFRILADGTREKVGEFLSSNADGGFLFEGIPYGTYEMVFDFGGGIRTSTQSFQVSAENQGIVFSLPVSSATGKPAVFYTDDDGNQLRYRNPNTILGPDVSNFTP